jgi:hypothetical protein
MRRSFFLGSSIAVAICLAGAPSVAEKMDSHSSVAIVYVQQKNSGRLNFDIGRLATPEVRTVLGGVELSFATDHQLRISEHGKAREVTGVESQVTAARFIVLVRLACECAVESSRAGKTFSLTLRDPPKSGARAATAAEHGNNEIAQLRESLTAKLASLNAPPATQSPRAAAPGTPAEPQAGAAAAIPRPACSTEFDMSHWKGAGEFRETLTSLRRAAADTHEAATEMATLAEFYLAYGLAGEAQDSARTALNGDVPPAGPDRTRLLRDADMAALLRGSPIDAGSPLLAERPGCERTDIPLWRALGAAAGHDAIGVVRDMRAARMALSSVPEPLLQAFAFRLADAAGDSLAALRDVAAALRNASIGLPNDESARFLLQAKIARLGGDPADEVSFLERAARHEMALPGIIAAERLAELRSTTDGDAGSHSEALLADMARVYRDSPLGQNAAAALAERHLRHADYAAALEVADESASPDGVRGLDSRGAAQMVRILRLLLVDPTGGNLPDPSERIALYLKYDGYATPGEGGDNIRLGAAKLMLSQDMASGALDVLHQLSNEVGSTPQGRTVRAEAEALAGDPAVSLLLLRDLPAGADRQRTGADALERMGRPGDAAHELEGLPTIADRTRRAALLCQAKAWSDAAAVYADLLRDPALTADARGEVADRYGFALALSGSSPDRTLPSAQGGLAARTLSALPPKAVAAAAQAPFSLRKIQSALDRAKQVETLLPSSEPKQGS